MNTNDGNIIRYEIDPTNPPPLTPEQQKTLNLLASMPDSEIDYSDIPPPQDMYCSVKEATTVKIDFDAADVPV
jgi:hypothetical protein